MKPATRHKARCLALQAIYQWELNQIPIDDLQQQFLSNFNPKKIDREYFLALIHGVVKNFTTLDDLMTPFLDRKITELNEVELAILRLAIFELKDRLDVPYKVIINEALQLAKIYGSEDGHKYVNGILDKVAQKLRKVEINP
jgi:transcription antitermination protein NusB